LAISDFYLFGLVKQKVSVRTLDSEENVLETITEILSEQPKDEAKNAFANWKEDASESQTTMESANARSQTPSYFDIVSPDP
jgi:hypothetical protein